MLLRELPFEGFVDSLGNAGSFGGGAVSAAAGALGAGSVQLVMNLTIGRKKYAEYEEQAKETAEKCAVLAKALAAGIDADHEAYNEIVKALALPKGTDEEKAARKAALMAGTEVATEAPFRVLSQIVEVLELACAMNGKYNKNTASDMGGGITQLSAGARTAWYNVVVNAAGIEPAKGEWYLAEGRKLMDRADAICSEMLADIEKTLGL